MCTWSARDVCVYLLMIMCKPVTAWTIWCIVNPVRCVTVYGVCFARPVGVAVAGSIARGARGPAPDAPARGGVCACVRMKGV